MPDKEIIDVSITSDGFARCPSCLRLNMEQGRNQDHCEHYLRTGHDESGSWMVFRFESKGKEVMPLITKILTSEPINDYPEKWKFSFEEMELNKQAQRDADLKYLMGVLDKVNAKYEEYLEAQKKEWARKEADWLWSFMEYYKDVVPSGMLEDAASHIAELRKKAEGK